MAQLSHLNELTGPRYFRLNQLEMETEFTTKEEIESNKRFRLIKLRDEGVPELKHYQMIPSDERLISEEVFQVAQRSTFYVPKRFIFFLLFFLQKY